jgi:hypothetical protein
MSDRMTLSTTINRPALPDSSGSQTPYKLPYQATHQVELLHLQAEIEALLQQLKTLKQQRLEVDPLEADATPIDQSPVLIAR